MYLLYYCATVCKVNKRFSNQSPMRTHSSLKSIVIVCLMNVMIINSSHIINHIFKVKILSYKHMCFIPISTMTSGENKLLELTKNKVLSPLISVFHISSTSV